MTYDLPTTFHDITFSVETSSLNNLRVTHFLASTNVFVRWLRHVFRVMRLSLWSHLE